MKTKTKIETKTSLIGLVLLIGVLIVGIAVAAGSDDMLRKYEESGKQFETVEIGDTIVYFHQRMIDDAIVEGDYIDYQFDSNTKELKKKIIHWRSDLPEHMPPAPMITKEQAESMAKGKVQFTTLYIISPDSVVFPLKPTPKNPCWIVRSIDNGNLIVTIIDAVDGKMLGYGVPPPYTGFSLSGPVDIVNCTGVWTAWYQNASFWFNAMGYPTEAVVYPDEAKVQSHIQSNETAMFYELAHGGSYSFDNNCSDSTNAAEIHNWIENYTKMPFTFIGSCGGMCDLSPNTHSYEFRKCSSKDTVTVGYCGMGTPNCTNAWSNSVDWQDALFNYMNQSNTVKEAFDKVHTVLKGCANTQNIIQIPHASDEDYDTEYLANILNIKVVDGVNGAIEHILRFGSGHSEAIITENITTAEEFLNSIDAAAVYVNASTRFTDGGAFGFGAEVGISTNKLHARGPMGIEGLTTYKFKIYGKGQIR